MAEKDAKVTICYTNKNLIPLEIVCFILFTLKKDKRR